jgi:hypothetical protein
MYYSGWRGINMSAIAETALLESIGHITGLREGSVPLGGRKVENGGSQTQYVISDFFKTVLSKTRTHSPNPLIPVFNEVKKAFIAAYSRENETFLKERLSVLRTARTGGPEYQKSHRLFSCGTGRFFSAGQLCKSF